MSDQTPNLNLPYLIAAQAQKHVTHNEALRALDAIVQIAVLDRDLAVPPATPADGAVVTFVGQTRETPGTPAPGQEAVAARFAGQRVTGLAYEAFEPMAR